MSDPNPLADAANLMPRVTGAINDLRTYAIFLTNYIDDYRRTGHQAPDTMRYMAQRLIEKNDYLAGELTVVKELLEVIDQD